MPIKFSMETLRASEPHGALTCNVKKYQRRLLHALYLSWQCQGASAMCLWSIQKALCKDSSRHKTRLSSLGRMCLIGNHQTKAPNTI